MPPLIAILPTLAAIGGLAGTGVGLGLELSNQPSGKPPATAPPTPAAIGSEQDQEKALISQQAPNVIAETSGLTNPDYVTQISQLLANTGGSTGSTGAARQVIQQIFGLPNLPGTGTGGGGTGGGGTGSGFTPAGTGATLNPSPSSDEKNLSQFVNQFF